MSDDIARNLWEGMTTSGQPIVLQLTDQQNWIRIALSSAQASLLSIGDQLCPKPEDRSSDDPLIQVIQALSANMNNPVHFGDNRPGQCTTAGVPLVAEACFTYWDLLGYGLSFEDGLPGFLKRIGLGSDVSEAELFVAAGLLLVDEAVKAVNLGNFSFAAYLLHQAMKTWREATYMMLDQKTPEEASKAIKSHLSSRGRTAGKLSGEARQRTAKAPPSVVNEMAAKLLAEGKADRDIAGIIAARLGVTPDYIRDQRKKPG